MRKTEQQLRLRLKRDFALYAQKCLKVRAKNGAVVPFVLNAAQRHIHALLEQQRAKTGRVRALILKGRQQGCSTYVEGRFYWKVTHQPGAKAFILTHLEEASRNIYQIAKRFHDNCPLPLKPHTSHSSSKELVFDLLDARYQVGTARSTGVGRSDTVQYFHGSEVAYWPEAADHVAGILQAVPDTAGTEIILESTSAGAAGLFYQLCKAAQKGESDYLFIFVPWHWQEEYKKTPPKFFILSEEEKNLKSALALDDAQLFWRRAKIAELGGLHVFRREYPATPDEAFLADHPQALWSRGMIEKNRVTRQDIAAFKRIVVAIDPAVSSKKTSDETGMIVAALGADGHGYVLEDLSGTYTPLQWAQKAVEAYYRFEADCVIAEVNQGGDMVEHTLRTLDPKISYKAVRASRGKHARAEPVAALDAQGRIHHTAIFARLEDQMCCFDPAHGQESPDRVDARIWALTELMLSRDFTARPRVWR